MLSPRRSNLTKQMRAVPASPRNPHSALLGMVQAGNLLLAITNVAVDEPLLTESKGNSSSRHPASDAAFLRSFSLACVALPTCTVQEAGGR